MGEITHFVRIYIENSDLLEESIHDIAETLESSIRQEAPYDHGRLKRSIEVTYDIYQGYGLISGTWNENLAPHGIFVLAGSKAVDGKLMKMPWGYRTKRKAIPPNDFLGRGLKRTLEAYR